MFVMSFTIEVLCIRDLLYTPSGCRQKAAVYKSIPNIPIYNIPGYLTKICLFDILHESGKILFYRNKIFSMNLENYLVLRNKVFIKCLSNMSDLYTIAGASQTSHGLLVSNNLILLLLLIPQAFH